MIGKTISHYKIIEKLGSGGMGEVYLAEDTDLDRKVALKFLPLFYSKDPGVNARFKREAKAAAALNHPNIVTVYEIGEYEDRAYIAMEYVGGESLREKIAKDELEISKIIEITSQICRGLSKAHEAGIVHRDIKPENIILNKEGNVKILDFGLAQKSGATKLTKEATTLGTLHYMSPEQCQSGEVDKRTDIWSVGVVLYEMICGKVPFQGEYENAISYSIMNEEPEPLARYKTDVSEELQRIIDKALDKERDTRYQNVVDLLTDLKREERDSSATIESVAKIRKGISGQKGVMVAGLLVILSLITFIILGRLQKEPAKPILPTHKQITFTGNVTHPAISPDGAFTAYIVEGKRLMLQDLSGGQAIELYKAQNLVIWPLWSPDGSELIVTALEGGSKLPEVLLVPRLGGQSRILGKGYARSWSPDGSWVALAYADIKQVELVNKVTKETRSLTLSGFQWLTALVWSPKADLLLLLTLDKGKYALWTVQIDGSEQRKVFEDNNDLYSPRWSVTGEAVYFFRRQDNTTELVKLSIAGESEKTPEDVSVLLAGLQTGDYFTLSAEGTQLMYTRTSEYSNLWLAELLGSAENGMPEPLPLTQGTSLMGQPSISPDGKWIAYTLYQNQKANIYKVPIEGGSPEQLTFSEANHGSPAWSPDGKLIAFGSDEGGSSKVWIMNSDGSEPTPFETSELSPDFQTTWSPDYKLLYLRPGNQNFHILDPETEEERALVQNDSVGYIFSPRYSPDGKKIAVFWNRIEYGNILVPSDERGPFARGLWVISLEDSSQIQVSDAQLSPVGWSPDGNWIYAVYIPPQNILVKVPASGGEPETVITLPGEITEASIGPYGRKFVFNLQVSKSDVWLVENFDPEVAFK